MKKFLILSALCSLLSALPLWAAPAKAKKPAAKPAAAKPAAKPAAQAQATSDIKPAQVKEIKEGELMVESTGTSKQRMVIGKMDPPAAFNLEDIQNFPEDRLSPVLSNPITFDEARDFSSLMESQDEKITHPWLPEISKAPYLTMKPVLEKPAKDWTFSVIDQGGTPVSKQEGKGAPPVHFSWSGDDKERGRVAVDTVYIPQLATTDKDGYRHTLMGQPVQFASILVKDKTRTLIEVSSKRIFLEKKSDLSKEAPVFLDKVGDLIREENRLPFGMQLYDNDVALSRARYETLVKYFSEKLFIPATQITILEPGSPDKRGQALAISIGATTGGAE